jgi:nicotinamidase-related amidase
MKSDLDGNAPDTSPVALLIVDMINDLAFPGAEELLQPAISAAHAIAGLKQRCHERGIPVIYANDNFGRWRSDFRQQVDHVRRDGCRGKPLADLLPPQKQDYFVLKPKHSAFYATTLNLLLEHLQCRHLIITGLTTDMCVMFTANDAYMRDFHVHVPSDCVAQIACDDNSSMLRYIERVLKADITRSADIDLDSLLAPVSSASS